MDRNYFLDERAEEMNNDFGKPRVTRENVKKFIEDLENNRQELFRLVRNRIEENEKTDKAFDSQGELLLQKQEHTKDVSDVILDMIIDVFKKANTRGGLIGNVDSKLGTLPKEVYGKEASQYNFNENGLIIDLSYTKPSQWNANAERIKNFLDDEKIDLKYLDRILATYGVKIERNYSVQDFDDDEVAVDLVSIIVDKARPRDTWKLANNVADVKVNAYAYQMLVTLRDLLFADVEKRIREKEELDRKTQEEQNKYINQLHDKTDEVLDGIMGLISDIFYGATKNKEEIDEVSGILGKLGTDPGDRGKSCYTFDSFGLTIKLNYSHTKESDSYALCFGDFVDWDYLKQKLLEKGIEITREVSEQPAYLGQKYHHYDVVTIKVNELTKNIGFRR